MRQAPQNVLSRLCERVSDISNLQSQKVYARSGPSGLNGRGWQTTYSTSLYRYFIECYFVFIGLGTVVYSLLAVHRSRSWAIADWLINYQGGFVRRGLPGEVIYDSSRLAHISPVLIVMLFTLGLYGVFLLSVRDLAKDPPGKFWILAVLLSPATLSFQLLDVASGFRKEIIYLAAFALLVALLRRSRISPAGAQLFMIFFIPVATLSHESLICFAPYFFAAFVVNGYTPMQAARQCAIPFTLGLGAALFCTRYPGDIGTARHICASLGYKLLPQGSEICSGGAIAYLGYTPGMAHREAQLLLRQNNYISVYAPLVLLAFAPLVVGSMSLIRSGRRRPVGVIWSMAGLSFLASLILFLYAVDWGRWIYIHIVSITVLLLCVGSGQRSTALPVFRKFSQTFPAFSKIALALLLVAYATLWTLPHAALHGTVPVARFGYAGLAYRLDQQYHAAHAAFHPHAPPAESR